MDFRLYARVLRRFKLLVAVGLLLAIGLAALSVARVGAEGIEYRSSELWASKTRLGVTQNGFPWGRLFAAQVTPDGTDELQPNEIPIANPARFNELAALYAELATSDSVLGLIKRNNAIGEQVTATPLRAQESGLMLPLIELTAISTSPEGAVSLARRSSRALNTYLRTQQQVNKVPASDRVVIDEVLQARQAEIFRPRSKTMPVVIFLAVMFGVIGLVFLLENLRPRRVDPGEHVEAELPDLSERRSA